MNGRHELNDLIVEAQQVQFQIVLVHNDQLVSAHCGLVRMSRIDVLLIELVEQLDRYEQVLIVTQLLLAQTTRAFQILLEHIEEFENLGEQIAHSRVVLDLLHGRVSAKRGAIETHAHSDTFAIATLWTQTARVYGDLTIALSTLCQRFYVCVVCRRAVGRRVQIAVHLSNGGRMASKEQLARFASQRAIMIARRLVTTHPTLELIISLVLGALLLLIATLLLLLLLLVVVMLLVMVGVNGLGKLWCHLMCVRMGVQIAILNAQKRVQFGFDDHVIVGLELFQEVALFQCLIGIQAVVVVVVVVGELAFA